MKKILIYAVLTLAGHSLFAASYTPSAPLTYSNQSNITISGKSFTSGSNGASITLTNCTNVKITNCSFVLNKDIIGIQLNSCTGVEISGNYFQNFRTGIYAVTCKGGINIYCNSFKDIAGIYPRGQIVQFNKCYGTGNRVNYNILDHTFGTGNPEDLINMYGSYGTTADPIQIIGNKLRGGGPSKSGGGIMIGDDGGHDIRVESNILVDVGQYGIGCPAGYNMTIKNNQVFGQSFSWTNVGIYVGLQGEINAGFACDGPSIRVQDNKVKFTNKNGANSGWYNCPCCPGVIQSGNNFNAPITASILPAVLTLDSTACGSQPVNTSTRTPTPHNTFTRTPVPTKTRTATRTRTATPVKTFTRTATRTATATLSSTAVNTKTFTTTATRTRTATPTLTLTSNLSPVLTPTLTLTSNSSPSFTATVTATPSSTVQNTAIFTATGTYTATRTKTITATFTATRTFTATASLTLTSNLSPVFTATTTVTRTVTATSTGTFTPSFTRTSTPENTQTFTRTATTTHTPTRTATGTHTPTIWLTATPSFTCTPDLSGALAFDGQSFCYPNPASATSGLTIGFDLKGFASRAEVKIYTVSGRLIRIKIAAGMFYGRGNKVVLNSGEIYGLSAGTYYWTITAGSDGRQITQKGVLIILK